MAGMPSRISPISDSSSQKSVSARICRICHDGAGSEALISPCRCRGTLQYAHASCIEHWLIVSDRRSCELCHFVFETEEGRPSHKEWLHALVKCQEGSGGCTIMRALAYMFVVGLIAAYLAYSGEICVMIVVICICCFVVYLYLRDEQVIEKWRDDHRYLRVVDAAPQLEHVRRVQLAHFNDSIRQSVVTLERHTATVHRVYSSRSDSQLLSTWREDGEKIVEDNELIYADERHHKSPRKPVHTRGSQSELLLSSDQNMGDYVKNDLSLTAFLISESMRRGKLQPLEHCNISCIQSKEENRRDFVAAVNIRDKSRVFSMSNSSNELLQVEKSMRGTTQPRPAFMTRRTKTPTESNTAAVPDRQTTVTVTVYNDRETPDSVGGENTINIA